MKKFQFEIRRFSTCYRIIKVYDPIQMYSDHAKIKEKYCHEEFVVELPVGKEEYVNIICESLNKTLK